MPRLPVAPEQFADPDVRRSWVEQRNLVAFTLYDPSDALRDVDLLATTPAQRLEWLEESLLLAQASGALARDRARRQRQAEEWDSSH